MSDDEVVASNVPPWYLLSPVTPSKLPFNHSCPQVLPYILWCIGCVENSVPLMTVEFLEWRGTLYTAACQVRKICETLKFKRLIRMSCTDHQTFKAVMVHSRSCREKGKIESEPGSFVHLFRHGFCDFYSASYGSYEQSIN